MLAPHTEATSLPQSIELSAAATYSIIVTSTDVHGPSDAGGKVAHLRVTLPTHTSAHSTRHSPRCVFIHEQEEHTPTLSEATGAQQLTSILPPPAHGAPTTDSTTSHRRSSLPSLSLSSLSSALSTPRRRSTFSHQASSATSCFWTSGVRICIMLTALLVSVTMAVTVLLSAPPEFVEIFSPSFATARSDPFDVPRIATPTVTIIKADDVISPAGLAHCLTGAHLQGFGDSHGRDILQSPLLRVGVRHMDHQRDWRREFRVISPTPALKPSARDRALNRLPPQQIGWSIAAATPSPPPPPHKPSPFKPVPITYQYEGTPRRVPTLKHVNTTSRPCTYSSPAARGT
jgi:hypothetical protein